MRVSQGNSSDPLGMVFQRIIDALLACHVREVGVRKSYADHRRQGEDPDRGTGLRVVLNIQPREQGYPATFLSRGVHALDSIVVPTIHCFSRGCPPRPTELLPKSIHRRYSTKQNMIGIAYKFELDAAAIA